MRIYIASHSQPEAASLAETLLKWGHEITSRWIKTPLYPTTEYIISDRRRIAQEDVEDVQSADTLVLISGPDKYSGGKFVETGIALALHKNVIVIGRRENMLIWHPRVTAVEDQMQLEAVLKHFSPITPGRENTRS